MKVFPRHHTLTEAEIRQILRESEGRSVGGRPPGHTVARHELFSPFSHRTNIYLRDLRNRFLEDGEERVPTSGAFQNGLVPALLFALTRPIGNEALEALGRPGIAGVRLRVNIEPGQFRIVYYKRSEGVLTPDRAAFQPLGEDAAFWVPRTGTAQGIFILLLKTSDDQIHIQTAYPIAEYSGSSTWTPIAASR